MTSTICLIPNELNPNLNQPNDLEFNFNCAIEFIEKNKECDIPYD